jgi:hypothetical protein
MKKKIRSRRTKLKNLQLQIRIERLNWKQIKLEQKRKGQKSKLNWLNTKHQQ